MPVYDFRCQQCDHKFTVMVSINEKDQVKCPKCESEKVQQLFTGFFTKKSSCGHNHSAGG